LVVAWHSTESSWFLRNIEARGTTQAQVAADTGIAESTISAILAGKRGMTRKHIESLARDFKVKPAVFLSS
jgi:HTH-type transcriptional regulator/antitoxin HigA